MEFLKRFNGALSRTVATGIRSGLGLMVRDVTTNRLRGQYLRRRTGTLIRSITASPHIEATEDFIRGWWGSHLTYARAHELGFEGTVQVPGHTRRLIERVSSKASAKRVRRALKAGRARFASVRPHGRRVHLRARRFMGDTVDAMGPEALRRVRRALIHLRRHGVAPSLTDLGGA